MIKESERRKIIDDAMTGVRRAKRLGEKNEGWFQNMAINDG